MDSIAERYVRLALAIDQHSLGYVDAYYGPLEWRRQAEAEGKSHLAVLTREVSDLATALIREREMNPGRRDLLMGGVRAMRESLRILKSGQLPLMVEAEDLYDITPEWVDESVFEEAHNTLDELLPPGDSLLERNTLRVKAAQVRLVEDEDLVRGIGGELRRRTIARFPLPAGESIGVKLVRDRPWAAYN